VGVAPVDVHSEDPTRFIADAMLGTLARWLRLLGFDTAWEPDIADAVLVRRSVVEGRIVLTRDRRLPQEWRVRAIHLIEADRPRAQVREVADRFNLAPRLRLLTRCSRCNTVLVPATRGQADGRVPPGVLAAADDLRRCPGCGRFYWSGSHVRRMRRMVEDMLG
jgi:uncharacterized protein with PIN domain